MKKFRIVLKSGDWTEWKAESIDSVYEKIDLGHRGILPVRGKNVLQINPETVEKVEEIGDAE